MQVGSRESNVGDARADVSCKYSNGVATRFKVRRVDLWLAQANLHGVNTAYAKEG
jgi:hypothetical protein